MTPRTEDRLRAAERRLALEPTDLAARGALAAARARAGVAAPVYWLVVPGGRAGRGRLHLALPPAACWTEVDRGPVPGDPVIRCRPLEWARGEAVRWADLSGGARDRSRLCLWCARSLICDIVTRDPVDEALDMWRWQLAWAAARGLPYPSDGAGAERVPELLAEVERELAAVGRRVVLPGSLTRTRLAGVGTCLHGGTCMRDAGHAGEHAARVSYWPGPVALPDERHDCYLCGHERGSAACLADHGRPRALGPEGMRWPAGTRGLV